MKLLITGPESSGKTTLSKSLSKKFNIPILPEHARTYLEKYGPSYSYNTLLTIAKQHASLFRMLRRKKHLILDTYLLNIKIWSEYKYKKCDPWIIQQLKRKEWDEVLLLKPNVKWEADPLRESENDRDILFQIYERELQKLGQAYFIIDGKGQKRLAQSIAVCKRLFE